MRVVLDTNVIISATLIRGGNEDQIGRALFYEKLRKFRWMTEEEIAELLQALAQGSALVSGRVKVKASRDPDDDKFLAAAVEAEAGFVVTGDRDLLDLKSYRGVRIVRPAQFLRIIRRTGRRNS